MPASAKVDCPFCAAKSVQAMILDIRRLDDRISLGIGSSRSQFQAPAITNCCRSYCIVYFGVFEDGRLYYYPDNIHIESIKNIGSTINDAKISSGVIRVTEVNPKIPKSPVPDHLPSNVLKAFEDANKSYESGIWSAAAAFYGKAIDRAITPLLDEVPVRAMLGQKLSMLKAQGNLPEVMIDWIDHIKNGRNFAMHDEDIDYNSAKEVEPFRHFATVLLEYLFTLPEQIKLAKTDTNDETGAS